jgi:hypothetical protein
LNPLQSPARIEGREIERPHRLFRDDPRLLPYPRKVWCREIERDVGSSHTGNPSTPLGVDTHSHTHVSCVSRTSSPHMTDRKPTLPPLLPSPHIESFENIVYNFGSCAIRRFLLNCFSCFFCDLFSDLSGEYSPMLNKIAKNPPST